MDEYGVTRVRAVATSAVREAANAETFLDRVRVRVGLDVEVIDGSEESRLTYLAVSERLHGHPALGAGCTLLMEVGGGSVDVTRLSRGAPVQAGVYPLGVHPHAAAAWQLAGLARAAHPAALRPDRECRRRHRRRDHGR